MAEKWPELRSIVDVIATATGYPARALPPGFRQSYPAPLLRPEGLKAAFFYCKAEIVARGEGLSLTAPSYMALVDARTASSTVPLDPTTGLVKEVPSYWVFNAMVKRKLNEHLDLQINVNNLANRYYYDELHPAHIVLGPGRSALIGLKFRF